MKHWAVSYQQNFVCPNVFISIAVCLYNEAHIGGYYVQIQSFHMLHMVADWRSGSRTVKMSQRNIPKIKSFWDSNKIEKETYVFAFFKSFCESIVGVFCGKEVVWAVVIGKLAIATFVVELENNKQMAWIWYNEIFSTWKVWDSNEIEKETYVVKLVTALCESIVGVFCGKEVACVLVDGKLAVATFVVELENNKWMAWIWYNEILSTWKVRTNKKKSYLLSLFDRRSE